MLAEVHPQGKQESGQGALEATRCFPKPEVTTDAHASAPESAGRAQGLASSKARR